MSLKRAHASMIRALTALSPPSRIVGDANSADVLNRADHLQAVYGIVTSYLEDVMFDTIDHFAMVGPVDQHEIECIVWDAVNVDPEYDVVGALSRAGCSLGLRAAA
jgi:hypothetical protein